MSAASPDLAKPEVDALRESIATLGQLVPIVIWRGKVIDGRKRLAACLSLNITPQAIVIPDDAAATDYASALNLLRTHYTMGQRALYAAALANIPHGQRPDRQICRSGDAPPVTAAQAGAMVGVGSSDVQKAKRLRREAAPEVVAAVECGALSLSTAARIERDVPKDQQAATVARVLVAKGDAKKIPPGTIKKRRTPRPHQKPPAEVLGRIIEGLSNTCEVLEPYIEHVGACSVANRVRWIQDLDIVLATLRRFRRCLQTERGNQ